MSILIKGMAMPKSRDTCDFCTGGLDCWISKENVCRDVRKGQRNNDCPVGYIPPHGRLGDLDRLAKEVKDMEKEFPPDSISTERYRLFAEFIKTAPTIIPAEEGET